MRRPQLVAEELSETLEPTIALIHDLRTLPDGWDGAGSISVSSEAITHACHVVRQLCAAPILCPAVSARPQGTIVLTWDTDQGSAIVEIGPDVLSAHVQSDAEPSRYVFEDGSPTDAVLLQAIAAALRAALTA